LRDAAKGGDDLPAFVSPPTVEYSRAMVEWYEKALNRRQVFLDRLTALDEAARRRRDLPLFASWTIGHARAVAASDVKDWQHSLNEARRDFERDHGVPYAPATCVATWFVEPHGFDGSQVSEDYRAEWELCDKPAGDPVHAVLAAEEATLGDLRRIVAEVDPTPDPRDAGPSGTNPSFQAAISGYAARARAHGAEVTVEWPSPGQASIRVRPQAEPTRDEPPTGEVPMWWEGPTQSEPRSLTREERTRDWYADLREGAVEPTRDELPDEPRNLPTEPGLPAGDVHSPRLYDVAQCGAPLTNVTVRRSHRRERVTCGECLSVLAWEPATPDEAAEREAHQQMREAIERQHDR
jgi:hypothetical protein